MRMGWGSRCGVRRARLAEAGYLALATDMLGGGRFYATPEETGVAVAPLFADPHLLRGRVTAWFDWLKARQEVDPARMGAIGYCFGGQCVLDLARSGADVKLVVSFHGLLQTALPAPPGGIKAEIAVYSGARDPFVPREVVTAFQDEMLAARARWQITVYGEAYHSFTDPDASALGLEGLAYDPLAEKLSWNATELLLEALL